MMHFIIIHYLSFLLFLFPWDWLYVTHLFSFAAFTILSLFCTLSVLIVIGLFLCCSFLFGILKASHFWTTISVSRLKMFSVSILLNKLLMPLLCINSSSLIPVICGFGLLMVSLMSSMSCSFFPSSFSLYLNLSNSTLFSLHDAIVLTHSKKYLRQSSSWVVMYLLISRLGGVWVSSQTSEDVQGIRYEISCSIKFSSRKMPGDLIQSSNYLPTKHRSDTFYFDQIQPFYYSIVPPNWTPLSTVSMC
jgi:hypothetical protein